VVANADDPRLADLVRGRERALRFGLDDPSVAREQVPHAADSTYCVVCGTPYEYAAPYVGHLGDYRCPRGHDARPALDVAARSILLEGLERTEFDLVTPAGTRRVSLRLAGLYNVYNAVAAASLALTLGAGLDAVVEGLERFRAAFGRFERIQAGDRTVLMLLVKNPAGANEAIRTLVDGRPPDVAVIALNDEIADGRDVSWIWDVDFEPLLAGFDRVIASGSRAAELALRFAYGGMARDRIELVPDLEQALDRGLALTPENGELVLLPTYTAMLALRGIVSERGHVAQYWERAA
jgi:UDP-N-acetylmuramyl tripeptide synthase